MVIFYTIVLSVLTVTCCFYVILYYYYDEKIIIAKFKLLRRHFDAVSFDNNKSNRPECTCPTKPKRSPLGDAVAPYLENSKSSLVKGIPKVE